MKQDHVVIVWPPAYKIKKHRRAKSVKLRTSLQRGLEITVPYRFSMREIPFILEENKDWIIRHLSKLPAPLEDTLPASISLLSGENIWQVEYMPLRSKLELFVQPDFKLVLAGRIENKTLCKKKLRAFLINQAEKILIPLLNSLSRMLQLPYNSIRLRDQRTLWGSCTAHKAISLNYKLIFLPLELVRHVLIHELCHTKYLNHSLSFWDLVGQHDKNWEMHKAALRKADKFIPDWLATL